MAHDTATHDSSSAKKRIWNVFIILSVLTIVEVVFGYIRPRFLIETTFVSMPILNWLFIILTIVKAYYIVWAFMHMEHETKGLRRVVVWTAVFLISYLIAILLIEGGYIEEVYTEGYMTWDF